MKTDGENSRTWITKGGTGQLSLGLVTAGLLLACGGAMNETETAGADSAREARQQDARATDRGQRADTVEVSLREFRIEMPRSIEAGPTVFRVTNDGSAQHNFEVEGEGVEEVFATNLRPGQTRTLRVDLRPGAYQVYCPVQDHADRGMRLNLEVTGPGTSD